MISAAILFLGGCAELPAPAPTSTVDYRACVVTDKASENSDLAQVVDYSVKQAVVTYGIHRSTSVANRGNLTKTISKLSKGGCNLFLVQGEEFAPQMDSLVTSNPEKNFVMISNHPIPKLISADRDNLVVYYVDEYEQGLVLGYLSAAIAAGNTFALGCLPPTEPTWSGIREGILQFDRDTNGLASITLRDSSEPVGLEILANCKDDFASVITETSGTDTKLVANGLDIYPDTRFKDSKPQIVGTVTTTVGSRIMEVIASDLEGDFVGGSLGSYNANYGNGGITVIGERDITFPTGLMDDLKRVTLDYETSSR